MVRHLRDRGDCLVPPSTDIARLAGLVLSVPMADIWGSAQWADRLIYLKTLSETRAQLTLGGQ